MTVSFWVLPLTINSRRRRLPKMVEAQGRVCALPNRGGVIIRFSPIASHQNRNMPASQTRRARVRSVIATGCKEELQIR